MTYESALSESRKEAAIISQRLHGLRLKSDARSKTAAACFAIAQQHHSSILILLSNRPALEATAMALLRLLLEATLRGLWVSRCATDEQVDRIATGAKRQVDMASVITELGKLFNLKSARSILYDKAYHVLSAYTHTYEQQVQRWICTNDIEPNYQPDEIVCLLERATDAMRLAAEGVRAITVMDKDKP
ncbi:DUF6988 family protein [Pseudomonas boanensis]|uniref:DUF6988 family protein n=1 Tax=Metapseudomonas boanensis TaxID=2822138 RepID=UPI0035D45B30